MVRRVVTAALAIMGSILTRLIWLQCLNAERATLHITR